MCEFVFLVNVVDVKAPFKAPFYMWRRGYLFRFVILKFIVKKMLFCIKRSFVWLKKIVFDESFYEIVLLFQFFSCTWLLLFLQAGRLCNVLSDLRLFFLFIWWFFFNDLMKYNHGFFSPVVFCEIFCLVSLRRGRFFPVDL